MPLWHAQLVRSTVFLSIFATAGFSQSLLPRQEFLPAPPAENPSPLTTGEKFHLFSGKILDPTAFAKSAATAAMDQWKNKPFEWEQGSAGFARRYSHKLGTRVAENAIGFSIAAALDQDPRYFRSEAKGVKARLGHAVKSTFLTRTDSGDWTFSAWRFGGAYGSAFLSNTWRPGRINGPGDALQRGTISIGFDLASNVMKEFWPDIKKKVFRIR